MPPTPRAQNNPELEAAWKLLQFMWNKHYQGVWQALQSYPWSAQVRAPLAAAPPPLPPGSTRGAALPPAPAARAAAAAPPPTSPPSPAPARPQARPLVDATALRFRGHMLDLISRAYTEISPARAASLLGISEQDALQLAASEGWQLDAAAGVLTVVAKPVDSRMATSFEQLQQLTEYMVHLEQ